MLHLPSGQTHTARFPACASRGNANTFDHSISESMDVAAHVGSFAAALDAAMSSPPLTDRIRRVCLGPAVDPSMPAPRLAYRQAYRKHRVGLATGASGERPDDESEMEDMSVISSPTTLRRTTPPIALSIAWRRVWPVEMNKNETDTLAAAVATVPGAPPGAAAGAKGEVGRFVRRGRSAPCRARSAHHQLKLKAETTAQSASSYRGEEKPVHVHVGAGRLGLAGGAASRAPRVTMAAFSSSSSVPRRLGPR